MYLRHGFATKLGSTKKELTPREEGLLRGNVFLCKELKRRDGGRRGNQEKDKITNVQRMLEDKEIKIKGFKRVGATNEKRDFWCKIVKKNLRSHLKKVNSKIKLMKEVLRTNLTKEVLNNVYDVKERNIPKESSRTYYEQDNIENQQEWENLKIFKESKNTEADNNIEIYKDNFEKQNLRTVLEKEILQEHHPNYRPIHSIRTEIQGQKREEKQHLEYNYVPLSRSRSMDLQPEPENTQMQEEKQEHKHNNKKKEKQEYKYLPIGVLAQRRMGEIGIQYILEGPVGLHPEHETHSQLRRDGRMEPEPMHFAAKRNVGLSGYYPQDPLPSHRPSINPFTNPSIHPLIPSTIHNPPRLSTPSSLRLQDHSGLLPPGFFNIY